MLQAQKKAKKDESAPTPGAGNSEARKAAKKAKAMLRSIKPPGLRALRNKILRDAIKQFEKDSGWVNGHLAATGNTDAPIWDLEEVEVHSPHAVRFCSVGAIKRFGDGLPKEAQQMAAYAVADSLPRGYREDEGSAYGLDDAQRIVTFNDDQKRKTPVINAFKRALKAPLRKKN